MGQHACAFLPNQHIQRLHGAGHPTKSRIPHSSTSYNPYGSKLRPACLRFLPTRISCASAVSNRWHAVRLHIVKQAGRLLNSGIQHLAVLLLRCLELIKPPAARARSRVLSLDHGTHKCSILCRCLPRLQPSICSSG